MNYGQIYNLNCVYAEENYSMTVLTKDKLFDGEFRNFVPISISNKDKDHNLRDVTAFETKRLANNSRERKSKKRGTNTDSLPITVIKRTANKQ